MTLLITFTEEHTKRKRVIDFINEWSAIINTEATATKTVDDHDNTVTTYETPTSKLVVSKNPDNGHVKWDWVSVPGMGANVIREFLEKDNGSSI